MVELPFGSAVALDAFDGSQRVASLETGEAFGFDVVDQSQKVRAFEPSTVGSADVGDHVRNGRVVTPNQLGRAERTWHQGRTGSGRPSWDERTHGVAKVGAYDTVRGGADTLEFGIVEPHVAARGAPVDVNSIERDNLGVDIATRALKDRS